MILYNPSMECYKSMARNRNHHSDVIATHMGQTVPVAENRPEDQTAITRYPPPGTLASYTDADGYTSRIDTLPRAESWKPVIYSRVGRKYIIDPQGNEVAGGYWMNSPELVWGISEAQWKKMSWQDRAALEVKEQATAYAPLKSQFSRRQRDPIPTEIEKIMTMIRPTNR